jgi:flagellar motor switch protein FliM
MSPDGLARFTQAWGLIADPVGVSTDLSAVTSAPASRNRASSGRVRRAGGQGPVPYDFRRPTKLSREHVRSLQIVFETFARQWTTLLTSSLRTVAQVSLASIEQLTYDEYISSLSNPTVVNVLSVEPLAGAGVLEFSLNNAMISVDTMLGGSGSGAQPQRPLSDIESSLLRQLVVRVLGELRYAFESIVRIEPTVISVEYNPQFAQAGSAADVVVVASFDMKVGADESLATICLPFASLFPLLELALGHGVTTERERQVRAAAKQRIESGLQAVPVEVSIGFHPTSVTPRTLVQLAVGDVVPLQHPVVAPLVITAAGVTFGYALAGSSGHRLAGLVVDPPADASTSVPLDDHTRRHDS